MAAVFFANFLRLCCNIEEADESHGTWHGRGVGRRAGLVQRPLDGPSRACFYVKYLAVRRKTVGFAAEYVALSAKQCRWSICS